MKSLKTAIALLLLSTTTAVHAQQPAIRSPGDLPATRFKLAKPPSQFFLDPAFIIDTLPKLRAEADRIRATYDIQDQALAEQLRSGLANIALLQGRAADARALIAESRAAATKPQLKAIGLLRQDAVAAALDAPADQRCAAAASQITRTLAAASDPLLVRDDALGVRTRIEVNSLPLLSSILEVESDPSAAINGGTVDLMDGLGLVAYRVTIDHIAPCRAPMSAAIQRFTADPAHQPTNIWNAREPATATFAKAKPVVVAVWDSGYDTTLFASQLARDPAEPIDGRDNDGNGIIDDWNGPTYAIRMIPDPFPMYVASAELAPQLAFQQTLHKGSADMRYGFDTPEALLFAQHSREASQTQQVLDSLLWNETGGRNHGTEVASEIADEAPYVQLFNVRVEPWGNDPREIPIDEAQNARWIAGVNRLGARLRSAGVRIVNMSWGYTADEIAEKLMRYGGVSDKASAVARGQAMHTDADKTMRKLIAECPNILFVNGAGNSNQSDDIFASTPQSIVAPNLIVVGATGTNGIPTSFTTFGKNVTIYAWGDAVPLRMPGGTKTRASGTSMSGPLVARAAAQMLAVNPGLNPAQLIEGMRVTATEEQPGLKLLHTVNAVTWAKSRPLR